MWTTSFKKQEQLISLIKSGDDNAAAEFIHHHPNEAKETDQDGNTPLHVACLNDSSQMLILYLLEVYPDATMIQNNYGAIPLHLICCRSRCHSSSTYHVMDMILSNSNSASLLRHNSYGHNPLFIACNSDVPYYILEHLLKKQPNAILSRDEYGLGPIQALWRCRSQEFNDLLKNSNQKKSRRNTFIPSPEMNRFWEKVCLLLRVYIQAIGEKCVVDFSKHHGEINLVHSVLILNETFYMPSLVKTVFLLHRDQIVPCTLHFALQHGLRWENGIKTILDIEPDAIEIQEPGGMFPFMTAASSKSASLETIFKLLQRNPTLVHI